MLSFGYTGLSSPTSTLRRVEICPNSSATHCNFKPRPRVGLNSPPVPARAHGGVARFWPRRFAWVLRGPNLTSCSRVGYARSRLPLAFARRTARQAQQLLPAAHLQQAHLQVLEPLQVGNAFHGCPDPGSRHTELFAAQQQQGLSCLLQGPSGQNRLVSHGFFHCHHPSKSWLTKACS